MYSILIIAVSLVLGGIGIGLFVKESQYTRRLVLGYEASRRIVIKVAVLNGLALSLSFLALEFLMAGFEKHHKWSIESILFMVALPIFLGSLVAVGLVWQFYTSMKYRNFIFSKLPKNSGDKEDKSD